MSVDRCMTNVHNDRIMSKLRFRRTARLKWVPLLIATVVLGYFVSAAVGGLLVVVCGVMTVLIVADSFTIITINGSRLSIGAGSRATTIANTDLVAVHYRTVIFSGRWFDLRCLELRSSQSVPGLIIPGTGWGKQADPLFSELQHWLESTPVVLEPNVETYLRRRQRLG